MLKLKVALKNHDPTLPFSFYGSKTQVKSVEGAFPSTGYQVDVKKIEEDYYLITLTKIR